MASESDPLVGKNTGQQEQNEYLTLYQIEERRRTRLMISLAVLALVSAMMGALLVWRLHVANERHQAELPTLQASQALDQLNRHINKQSKHVPKLCTSTLLLMRHCEKEGPYTTDPKDNTEHCSYIGYERAAHFATLFGSDETARWPVPAHLFALTPDRGGSHLNFRQWETLKPLSDQIDVVTEIHSRVSLPKVYFELLRSGSMCDQVVVVSWKHEFIPELARALGCGPRNGCPDVYPEDDFDQVWQLTYVFHPVLPSLPDEDELRKDTNFTSLDGEDGEPVGSDTDDSAGARFRRELAERRQLKHHSGDFSHHGWNVYATINRQNFDPLAFSKATGDYSPSTKTSQKKGGSSYNADGGL